MNDKELADKVVALGVLLYSVMWGKYRLWSEGSWLNWEHAKDVVHDWKIAGALMEKRLSLKCDDDWLHFCDEMSVVGHDESLPRAIIEACVEALQEHCDD